MNFNFHKQEKIRTDTVFKHDVADVDYFATKAVSNSELGLIKQGVKKYQRSKFKKDEEVAQSYFSLGSAVHWNILEDTPIKEVFTILDELVKVPSSGSQIDTFLKYLAIGFTEEMAYEKVVEQHKTKQKIDSFIKKRVPYEAYLQLSIEAHSSGKPLLTNDQYRKVLRITTTINEHPVAKDLLYNKPNDDYLAFNELMVEWTPYFEDEERHSELRAKSKIDRFLYNVEEKHCILIDVKTTGKPIDKFVDNYEALSYYRQVAFYKEALDRYFNENIVFEGEKPFTFDVYFVVVETSFDIRNPFDGPDVEVFKVGNDDLIAGKQEWIELYKLLEWHTTNNVWIRKDRYENGYAAVELNIFNQNESQDDN
jgi:hypothetical protein